MIRIGPWQVWLTDFSPQLGSEQAGVRPAIIVGSSLMCDVTAPRLALVVPCTTRDRSLPWQPALTLDRISYAMCEQVKSISRERLVRRLPHQVPDAVRDEIRQTLADLLAP